jgi:monovalent cation/hydrogen antiporter
MNSTFMTYIYLLFIIAMLVMVAQRLRISYPIVLVVGGLLLSFTGLFPVLEIEPELIFVIFLPPLLYEAAWHTTWKDFWRWRRIILSYAFVLVLVTSSVIAVVSNSLIPGFTLALGYLLGGIISPPDAVSATSIMKEVDVPKRISAIVEGESLLNDASSIIVFRFALAAVASGSFVLREAAGEFVVVIVMGTLVGLAMALVFYALHRFLPTTPSIDIVLTFVAPYAMYISAERFHFSGVLAVVSGGLLLSALRQTMLSPMSRIQGASVWSILGFVLNGLIFMLIGLQLPLIVHQMGDTSLEQAIRYSVVIAGVLIGSRLLIALGSSVFTSFTSRFTATTNQHSGFGTPIILGWAGMRGVVSLAAALSIPLYLSDGTPFPQRNLILFITFSVILITLVFQGLTLPVVIRLLKVKDPDYQVPPKQQERVVRKKLTEQTLRYLDQEYADQVAANELLRAWKQRLETELAVLEPVNAPPGEDPMRSNEVVEFEAVTKEIIAHQRTLLQQANKKEGVNEEVIRKFLHLLDVEEERLRERLK